MMRAALTGVGALAWGAVVFVVAISVHFPQRAILDRARWELQERSAGDYAFDATRVAPWMGSGLVFDNLVLYSVDKPRRRRPSDEDMGANARPIFRADHLSFRAQLLPLLSGRKQAAFKADLFGGTLDGIAGQGGARSILQLEGRSLDLGRMPISGDEWSVDATGLARLDVDLDVDTDKLDESKGKISLAIEDLALHSIEAMGFTYDQPIPFKKAELELEIEEGKATITKGIFAGDVIDANLEGDFTLSAKGFSRSRMEVKIKVDLADDLDRMAKMVPGVKDARDDEGTYHFVCSGSLTHPRCREDRLAAGNSRTSGNVGSRRASGLTNPPGSRGPGMGMGPEDLMEDGEDGTDAPRRGGSDRLNRLRDRRSQMNGTNLDNEDAGDLGGVQRGPRGNPIGPGMRNRRLDEDLEDGPMDEEDFDNQPPPMPDEFEDFEPPGTNDFDAPMDDFSGD